MILQKTFDRFQPVNSPASGARRRTARDIRYEKSPKRPNVFGRLQQRLPIDLQLR